MTITEFIFPTILLILGFAMLVKGADLFVGGSTMIADKLGVSQLVIALTIVAMGTSIPETAVTLFASAKGSSDIALGNIVGTNILNILLILGFTAVLIPLSVSKSTIKFEMPIMIFTAILFPILGLGAFLFGGRLDGMFSRTDGIILLAFFVLYLLYLYILAKKSNSEVKKSVSVYTPQPGFWLIILVLILGLGLVIAGSSLAVESARVIAQKLGVSERIIGLTVIAFGTSLPELATSVTAAIKKQYDMAVGNIVGSNIFNMLFIGGISSIIKPVPFSRTFRTDSIVCIGSSVLLLLLVLFSRKKLLSRFSGMLMLCLYVVYLGFIII